MQETGKRSEEQSMVFLGAELRDAEDGRVSFLLAFFVEGDGADDFVHGDGGKEDGDRVGFPPPCAGGTPERADVRGGPGAVCHY